MVDRRFENDEFRKNVKNESYPFDNTFTNIFIVGVIFMLFTVNLFVAFIWEGIPSELIIITFYFEIFLFVYLLMNIKHLKETNSLLKQKVDILLYESDKNKEN